GEKLDSLNRNEIVSGPDSADAEFIKVELGDGTSGFVRRADLEPLGERRPEVDKGNFVAACINVERAINDLSTTDPWFISGDFLIARAIIETNVENAGHKLDGSDAVGPLQVSSEEWKRFLDGGGALATPFRPGDFDEPIMQIWAAGFRMFLDARA